MKKLPFVPGVFFKMLMVVIVLYALIWTVAIWFMDYGELSTADKVGTLISGILAAYLFHLWAIPTDDYPFEESSNKEESTFEEEDQNQT